jgi:amino acid transporter
LVLNILHRTLLRFYFAFATAIFVLLFLAYLFWIPITSIAKHTFNSVAFDAAHNGVNEDGAHHFSYGYAWAISSLYPFWVFFGFDSSVHISEETKQASKNVPKGMYISTLFAYTISIPVIAVLFASAKDLESIYTATYANNWADFLVQVIGRRYAIVILIFLWISGTCTATSCFMSAQRVTYAIARDGLFPFKGFFTHVSCNNIPTSAAIPVYLLSVTLATVTLGSEVALQVLGTSAAMATNISYIFPIVLRQTSKGSFVPGAFRLGRLSKWFTGVSFVYVVYLVVVLFFPQEWPVTRSNANYGSWALIPAITLLSVGSWFWLPIVRMDGRFKYSQGAKSWFKGPGQGHNTLRDDGEAIPMDDISRESSNLDQRHWNQNFERSNSKGTDRTKNEHQQEASIMREEHRDNQQSNSLLSLHLEQQSSVMDGITNGLGIQDNEIIAAGVPTT